MKKVSFLVGALIAVTGFFNEVKADHAQYENCKFACQGPGSGCQDDPDAACRCWINGTCG